MLPALLNQFYLRWLSLRAAWTLDTARHEKLATIFKAGQQVKSESTGLVYRVDCSQMCYALLTGEGGKRVIVDWLTPAGSYRLEVADNWSAAEPLGASA